MVHDAAPLAAERGLVGGLHRAGVGAPLRGVGSALVRQLEATVGEDAIGTDRLDDKYREDEGHYEAIHHAAHTPLCAAVAVPFAFALCPADRAAVSLPFARR